MSSGVSGHLQVGPIAFAAGLRFAALTLQPQQTEDDNEQRADKPQPAARALVPKKLVGIIFWICGVPGRASMVNENAPEGDGGGSAVWDPALAK